MVPRSVIDEFLSQKSLAVVGVSQSGGGFGNSVRKDLRKKGYEVHVVHPRAETIGGDPCARSLAEVASKVTGMVLITPPAETEKLVREAAELGIPRVWMQQGAESKAAIDFCRENGIDVVHGECILMFAEPAGFVHRAHRWVRGATGELPR